jgi:thioredoxin 1
MMEPVLTELAAKYAGKLRVGKLNVDQDPQTAQRYGILGVPTLALFRDGEIVDSQTGAQSERQLSRVLNEVFGL